MELRLQERGDELETARAANRELMDLEWRRSIVRLVVERVVVNPGHPGAKTWRGFRFNPEFIEIQWRV